MHVFLLLFFVKKRHPEDFLKKFSNFVTIRGGNFVIYIREVKEDKKMIYLMMIEGESDKRKFVVLYEKYRYLMFNVAFDVLRDKHLAEDAVHEAFIKVAKNMPVIGDAESMETKRYLITVTKNSTIDIYRRRNIQMKHEVYVDELANMSGELTYEETDVDNRVLDTLKNLPVKYRDVFLLKYASGMENKEIAELLRISEGAVRQRISRGKEILEKALKELGGKADGAY